MEKRVILFLVLSVMIIIGWNFIKEWMGWVPVLPETEQFQPTEEFLSGSDVRRNNAPPSPLFEAPDGQADHGDPSVPEKRLQETLQEEIVTVESDLFRAEFSTRGGVITSWTLNRYSNTTPDGPVPVELMYSEGQFRGPLNLHTSDDKISKILEESLYSVSRDFSRLDERNPVGHLTFTLSDPDHGVKVEKRLTFHDQQYLVDVDITTEGLDGQLDVGLGTNFGIVEWGQGYIGLVGPAYLMGDEVEKDTPEQEAVKEGPIQWLALQDKYFMSVLIPVDGDGAVLTTEMEKVVSAAVRFDHASSSILRLYAGPKEYDTLKNLNVRLEETIDFGWFLYGSWTPVRAVAMPLFTVLKWLYGYTGNFGFAIILVTVCIKLMFVPLQYKSYKSMKDMQIIQPKVQELQKRLKDDRDRLNKELMKLYKDHKVNPVGGCLPMILQMPVFIALFNILYMTIDLRQAPFILWITDLSAPDPFFVLPIVMGASMVLQQKIMPTTMDPTQAKMMLLLPVFLTFIFLNFAAGLVLYWITNNLLTITQQFVTDRYVFKRPTFATATNSGTTLGATSSGKEQPETSTSSDGNTGGRSTPSCAAGSQDSQDAGSGGGGARRRRRRKRGIISDKAPKENTGSSDDAENVSLPQGSTPFKSEAGDQGDESTTKTPRG